MFDSPLEWCSACRGWVALDQTFDEHLRECGGACRGEGCPLAALFRQRAARAGDHASLRPPVLEQ